MAERFKTALRLLANAEEAERHIDHYLNRPLNSQIQAAMDDVTRGSLSFQRQCGRLLGSINLHVQLLDLLERVCLDAFMAQADQASTSSSSSTPTNEELEADEPSLSVAAPEPTDLAEPHDPGDQGQE